ncbi:SDCB2 protein, partial [Centropus bengalensis]|nr:SDCB2 protein [Centropus bengalensis]
MATLYPSLEDMKGHQILQAQAAAGVRTPATAVVTEKPKLISGSRDAEPPVLYPNLAELENYMGLALSSEEIQKNLFPEGGTALTPVGVAPGQLVAPLSGNNAGMRRAEIKPGVREIHLCKDERGKTGLQLKNVDQVRGLGWHGLRGTGWWVPQHGTSIGGTCRVTRGQRVIPSWSGLGWKGPQSPSSSTPAKGKIVSLAKDSSAARNGLLTHHYICEVNGQNVIGMKDKQLQDVLAGAGNVVTLTIIPTVIYEHMVKRLSAGQVKSAMDHSIPDL